MIAMQVGRLTGHLSPRAHRRPPFLGALAQDESIILSRGGRGKVEFAATTFTTGPDAGSSIRFGALGTNLVIVLIENNINGLTPSPVGPVPGAGVALSGTF